MRHKFSSTYHKSHTKQLTTLCMQSVLRSFINNNNNYNEKRTIFFQMEILLSSLLNENKNKINDMEK